MDKVVKYNVFGSDIFTAMGNGLKTQIDYFKGIKKSGDNDLNFRIESLNEMIGESADAFFGLSEFREKFLKLALGHPPNRFVYG